METDTEFTVSVTADSAPPLPLLCAGVPVCQRYLVDEKPAPELSKTENVFFCCDF